MCNVKELYCVKGSIKLVDFIVIGGGYTGLSVSTELIDHGYKVQLLKIKFSRWTW